MKTTRKVNATKAVIPTAIMCAVALLLASLPSQADDVEKLPLLTVDALAANAGDYVGKAIVLHGYVDRVSIQRGMVTLIDPSEAKCADACQRKIVVATMAEGTEEPLPEARKDVLAYGSIQTADAPLQFTVTRIITDPEVIKKEITSNTKR